MQLHSAGRSGTSGWHEQLYASTEMQHGTCRGAQSHDGCSQLCASSTSTSEMPRASVAFVTICGRRGTMSSHLCASKGQMRPHACSGGIMSAVHRAVGSAGRMCQPADSGDSTCSCGSETSPGGRAREDPRPAAGDQAAQARLCLLCPPLPQLLCCFALAHKPYLQPSACHQHRQGRAWCFRLTQDKGLAWLEQEAARLQSHVL